MRDPKRIETAMTALNKIWQRNPDLRFHQLVEALKTEYVEKEQAYAYVIKSYQEEYANGHAFERAVFHTDMFYLEDDKWIDFLVEFAEEGKS